MQYDTLPWWGGSQHPSPIGSIAVFSQQFVWSTSQECSWSQKSSASMMISSFPELVDMTLCVDTSTHWSLGWVEVGIESCQVPGIMSG